MNVGPTTALLQAISRAAATAPTTAALRPAAPAASRPATATSPGARPTPAHGPVGASLLGHARHLDPNLPRGSIIDITV